MINLLPVVCVTQFGPCPDHYLSARNLKSYPEVASIKTTYRFPFTRQINIRLRTPLGTVGSPEGNPVWLSDEAGVLFTQTSNLSLPILVLTREFKLLDKLTEPEVTALKILSSASHLSSTRLVGTLNNSDLTFYLNSTQVLMSSPSGSLQELMARSRIDGKLPRKIDLRFSQPIVTY